MNQTRPVDALSELLEGFNRSSTQEEMDAVGRDLKRQIDAAHRNNPLKYFTTDQQNMICLVGMGLLQMTATGRTATVDDRNI